jgi:hypothetical protein
MQLISFLVTVAVAFGTASAAPAVTNDLAPRAPAPGIEGGLLRGMEEVKGMVNKGKGDEEPPKYKYTELHNF